MARSQVRIEEVTGGDGERSMVAFRCPSCNRLLRMRGGKWLNPLDYLIDRYKRCSGCGNVWTVVDNTDQTVTLID